MVDRARDSRRSDYPYRLTLASRWEDNDMLCHINNVIYFNYFQQAFVKFLDEEGGIDWFNDAIIPFAAESSCRMLRPLSYPDVIDVVMRVETLGKSSVTYAFALFRQGDDAPAACGRFVHVYVDRQSQRPAPIPAPIRAAYERIQIAPTGPDA
jgi:acyl-CoA thioester hydrolase